MVKHSAMMKILLDRITIKAPPRARLYSKVGGRVYYPRSANIKGENKRKADDLFMDEIDDKLKKIRPEIGYVMHPKISNPGKIYLAGIDALEDTESEDDSIGSTPVAEVVVSGSNLDGDDTELAARKPAHDPNYHCHMILPMIESVNVAIKQEDEEEEEVLVAV